MPGEIATLKEQIEHEYIAAQLGLSGLATGMSRHQWITARQERLGSLHEQLEKIVGGEAIMIMTETLNHIPEQPTRAQVQQMVLREWGRTSEAQTLLDDLDALWLRFDALSACVGVEAASKMLIAAPVSREEVLPS